MDNFDDIKTDENIANILRKLKNAKVDVPKHSTTPKTAEDNSNNVKSYEVPVKDIPVMSAIPRQDTKQEVVPMPKPEVHDNAKDSDNSNGFTEDSILPWFSKADKDLSLLHYIRMTDSGDLEYCSMQTDRPAESIAALKLKPDYLCDIDYYISRHYVLYVKQLESDYSYHRTYTSESANSNPEMVKIDSDDIDAVVAGTDRYNHYVVFTDLGVADFIARQDDISHPCCNPDLSKWFEEVSNRIQLKNVSYVVNSRLVSDAVADIKDFKYDIITMHMPGVITLDSADNTDPDYQVHIRLKDEFAFLPLSRVLGCLKLYSTSEKKGMDDFRKFINKYFDVIAQ